MIIIFSVGLLPGPGMIKFSQGKWIRSGFSGRSEVSPSLAASYLWRNIAFASGFVLIFAVNIGTLSWKLVQTVLGSAEHTKADQP